METELKLMKIRQTLRLASALKTLHGSIPRDLMVNSNRESQCDYSRMRHRNKNNNSDQN